MSTQPFPQWVDHPGSKVSHITWVAERGDEVHKVVRFCTPSTWAILKRERLWVEASRRKCSNCLRAFAVFRARARKGS